MEKKSLQFTDHMGNRNNELTKTKRNEVYLNTRSEEHS